MKSFDSTGSLNRLCDAKHIPYIQVFQAGPYNTACINQSTFAKILGITKTGVSYLRNVGNRFRKLKSYEIEMGSFTVVAVPVSELFDFPFTPPANTAGADRYLQPDGSWSDHPFYEDLPDDWSDTWGQEGYIAYTESLVLEAKGYKE